MFANFDGNWLKVSILWNWVNYHKILISTLVYASFDKFII